VAAHFSGYFGERVDEESILQGRRLTTAGVGYNACGFAWQTLYSYNKLEVKINFNFFLFFL
tara:strand:- start:317 stop:499 length:183 start_codon:yes stop_codon:yes gene_type:complete